MQDNRPRIGVGIFVMHEGQFLIGQRQGAHGAGQWGLPGGHLEHFEAPEECARREVLEETGLAIDELRFLAWTNDLFAAENKHYVTLFFIGQTAHKCAERREPDKILSWEWRSIDKMPHPLFLPLQNLLKRSDFQAIWETCFCHPPRSRI